MTIRLRSIGLATALSFAAISAAPSVDAFCGFYVAGADQKLFNNATMVVLMREGTRTVLSMQNNYQGPPENFAMVVPVPVVLQKENVKTLPMEVFDKIDKLASPRLVEYWEQDPCAPPRPPMKLLRMSGAVPDMEMADEGGAAHGVKIEAQFKVGEYEVVILSARDSLGLDTWLRQEKYKIPDGAEPILRPYVQGGSKFFVAKVDAKKVRFQNGMAQLSPLRFHYDSETFALPVRLGLVNSSGAQDLIVHILARGQRYETANYPNVAIPTNLDVKDEVRKDFGAFYAALFDRTVARNPRAVITEYSWDASTCDPCPGPTLDGDDFATLGEDVLNGADEDRSGGGFVLTRLHLRYGKDGLSEDLIFRQAPAIIGGREVSSENGKVETGAVKSEVNNFQGRYIIRHEWTGPIKCENPRRGIWGGPPDGGDKPPVEGAQNLAFAKRGAMNLSMVVARDDKETQIDTAPLVAAPAMYAAAPDAPGFGSTGNPAPVVPAQSGGCAGCRVGDSNEQSVPAMAGIAAAIAIALSRIARRSKSN